MPVVQPGTSIDGGAYVEVAGDVVWHFHGGEGSGPPIVLLHGAFGSASTWGPQIAGFLDAGHTVFAPERSGHGHSPDVGYPYTFEGMAAQTIAYLDSVVCIPAHLVGWADGGLVALLVAHHRPDLVARMVTVGSYVDAEGRDHDSFVGRIRTGDPEIVTFLRGDHDSRSPDGPEHFPVVFDKIVHMLSTDPYFRIDDFSSVPTPTLVVAADRGVVRLESSIALARTLPHGRLAVLPGTHVVPAEAPELFNPLVLSFLAADPPDEWMPPV
ncbi:alpha/beta hydrolase [Gordonia sp. ABSL1-1]|uniref:alpha/beta fold hydrolase n=1 Tax=Gordonia sp. ABSL1-1 TaxID=3053923 RepID=UPI0025730524|nr:alpha/beta hydrolase [Gordonia sp. ABSL1-1]MDL9936140.1 alpha/beta hydrolase [Gordonia sp. ABSL1-1]